MTPAATTPAARGSKSGSGSRTGAPARKSPSEARSAAPSQAARTGHRSKVRKPSVPRRVSGPTGGATGTRTAPKTHRRPARRRSAARPQASLLARAQAFVVRLPDHSLLDRVVRGRAWIPILGVLLAGIVAMQVEVLKLNASMGRSLERGTALASRNQQLRASVSALSDDARIERLAAAQGMVMPAPEAVTFLSPGGTGTAVRAARNIHAPQSAGFIAALPAADTPAGAALAAGTTATASTAASTATPTASTTTSTATTASSTVSPAASTTTPVGSTTTSPATVATTPSSGG